ncbi:hypothetical protein ACTG15_01035 [Aeromonas sp. 164P]
MTDGAGNQLFSLNADGSPADASVCSYEYAFALLAECWLYRLSGEPRWQQQAESRYQAIELLFADPLYGGFHSCFPLALCAVKIRICICSKRCWWQRNALMSRAGSSVPIGCIGCFASVFWNPPCCASSSMMRLLDPSRFARLIDPGHHYEWCWLLIGER